MLFICSFAYGQINLFYRTDSILKSSGYFVALDSLRINYKNVLSDSSNTINISIANQAMMTYHSFVGNIDSSLYYEQLAHNTYRYEPLNNKTDFNYISADTFILNKCKNSRAVLFNENHNRTHTRYYLLELLAQLKEMGFTTLALEDLRESNQSLVKREYPILSSGFYIKEPVFAELVREAIRLGFKLLPYEQEGATHRGEASGQYLSRYLNQNSTERLIILGGYGFLYKTNKHNYDKTVAQVLQNNFGNSIVSLDCISFTEMFDPEKESELYRYSSDSIKIDKPSVLRIREELIFPYFVDSNMVDASIFFPRTKCQSNCCSQKIRVSNPIDLNTGDSLNFIQVYYYKEFKKHKTQAIPYIQFEQKKPYQLLLEKRLKKGRYLIIQGYNYGTIEKKIRIR